MDPRINFETGPLPKSPSQQHQDDDAPAMAEHILTLSCPDKPGIVHAVTGVFAAEGHNILDLQQFSDAANSHFFMRVHFGPSPAHQDASSTAHLVPAFEGLAASHAVTYHFRPVQRRTRTLIMVSKMGHCLNDLLFRMRAGQLLIDVPVVVSNHRDHEPLARAYGIEFVHLPVTRDTKAAQEARVLELVKEHSVELVVLARYMQVLSPAMCAALNGRVINIHHSFLPSFKGARPYFQAFDRGVKLIGATAHFVTPDLDEGPIIEQRVTRVDHTMDPRKLTEEGANVESQTLAAAVGWYAEGRVFLNGSKTVVL